MPVDITHADPSAVLAALGGEIIKRNGKAYRWSDVAIDLDDRCPVEIVHVVDECRGHIKVAPATASGVDMSRVVVAFRDDIVEIG